MNKRPLLFLVILTSLSNNALALEFSFGIEAGSKSVWVEEKARGENEIAKMESGISYRTSLGLRTESTYLNGDSNWGYHYQLDTSIFRISKQEISGVEEELDVGTTMKGYSMYAVPVAYYHFNKGKLRKWTYKAGIGVGIGYLKLSGKFKITERTHPEYNQIKDVDVEGFDLAVGIYIEATYDRHIIVIQNYAPTVSDDQYEYQQHNVIIAYRYTF